MQMWGGIITRKGDFIICLYIPFVVVALRQGLSM